MLSRFARKFGGYLSADSGASAIEYSILATFIFLGLIPLIDSMSGSVTTMYGTILAYFDAMNG